MMIQPPLGRHIGIAGGMSRALRRARAQGYTTAQVFPGNPTGWRHVPLAEAAATEIRAEVERQQMTPLVIHAPYIINLATGESELATKSRQGVLNAFERACEIGAQWIVVHAGSHKGDGEGEGIRRMAALVEGIMDTAPAGVELLIENSAGAGNVMAGSPESLGRLLEALPPMVGTCIDTAHLWGGGLSIDTPDGIERTIERIDRAVGLARLRVLHVNDSAVAFDSKRDVHAHLGEGHIGLVGLSAWMRHPALHGRPIILETPDEEDDARETERCTIAQLLLAGEVAAAAERVRRLQTAPEVVT